MIAEDLLTQIRIAQFSTMENTFKMPPQDYAGFMKQVGFYLGLQQTVNAIEKIKKAEKDD